MIVGGLLLLLLTTLSLGRGVIAWLTIGIYIGYLLPHKAIKRRIMLAYKLKRHSSKIASFKSRYFANVGITIDQRILVAAANHSGKCVYIDSGCSITIINDEFMLSNIREIHPICVQGVSGTREINWTADYNLVAISNYGIPRSILIRDVLYDPDSP
eukprot:525013-Rhodomonas_salina.1